MTPAAAISRAPRAFRAVAIGLLMLAGAFAALLILAFAALQVDAFGTWTARRIARALVPADTIVVTIDRVSGSWIRSLHLAGVRIETSRGRAVASVDTLHVSYRLLPLLWRRLEIDDARAVEPRVYLTRGDNGAVGLAAWTARQPGPTPARPAQPAEVERDGWHIAIGTLQIVRAAGRLTTPLDATRSTNGNGPPSRTGDAREVALEWADVDLELRDLTSHGDLAFALDSATGRIDVPAVPAESGLGPLHFRASARLADGQLVIPSLDVTGPNSRVRGGGNLALPDTIGAPIAIDFDLAVDSFPLAVAHAALGNPPAEHARLTATLAIGGTTEFVMADVDAATNDGGTVIGSAAFATGGSGIHYRAKLEVASIDPALLTGDTTLAGRVDGRVDVNLEGPEQARLGGHARAAFDHFRMGPAALRSARFESEWNAGEAAVDVVLAGDDVDANLEGVIRPFDDAPRYDLRGPFRLRIAGDTGDIANLAGRLTLAGTGMTPDSARASAGIALSQIALLSAELESGNINARLADGRITWRLVAHAQDDGSITANGAATVGRPIRFRIERAVIRQFDVAALLGDSVPSRIEATLTGSGAVGAPDETRADIRLVLRDGRYGRLRIDTTTVEATLERGLLQATGRAASSGGRLDFDVHARPFRDVPDYEVKRLTFVDVDVGALTSDTALYTRISGSASGSGRGTSFDQLTLDLDVQLDSSRINGQSIEHGEARVAVREGHSEVHAEFALADSGSIRLAASGRPFAEVPAFTIEEATFRALDPFALTAGTRNTASLNGHMTGTIEGLDPETMLAEGALVLDVSRINRERIDAGRVDWLLRDARLEGEADIAFESGRLTADADVRFGERAIEYVMDAELNSERAGRIAGLEEDGVLRASLVIDGRGTSLASMTTRIRAVADSAVLGDARVHTFRLALLIDQGVLRIDTLTMRSNVAHLTGGGSVPVSDSARATRADLLIEASIDSLRPIRRWLGLERASLESGSIRVAVTGPADSLALDASATASSLLLGETTLLGFESALEGRLSSGLEVLSATGHVQLDRLSTGDVDVQSSRIDGAWDGDELALEGNASIDQRRQVDFGLRVDARPESRYAVLEQFDFRADQDQWQLVRPATLSWARGLRVDSLTLRAGDQSIALNGLLDTTGRSDLVGHIEVFRIGTIADLVGYERLDGVVTASFQLGGSAADPHITGEVDASLTYRDGQSSDVIASLTYDTLRLTVDAAVSTGQGGALTIAGVVPIDLALTRTAEGDTTRMTRAAEGRVDLAIRADSFNVEWAEPFLDPEFARGMAGTLMVDARITGTNAEPVLSGSARLTRGRLTVPRLGVTYADAAMRVSLDRGVARIDSARARTGDGSIRWSGTIALTELSLGEFDIEARLDEFRAINTDAWRARVSGMAALRGTTAEPRLEGDLQLLQTDVYLDNVASGANVRPVQLTEEQIRELEDYFGLPIAQPDRDPDALFDALAIDLDLTMSRDTWVRQRANPRMDVQLTGDVRVMKAPADSIRLDGRIEAVAPRSYVEQFGKQFRITRGVVDLRGRPMEANIDISASYRVPSTRDPDDAEVTITLDIDGRLTDLDLTLGSDPQMENADIISYLATGRPAAVSLDLTDNGDDGVLRSVSSEYALTRVTNIVEGLATRGVALDVIEIQPDGLRGATLIAGRYVSPRVYVGFKQPIGRETESPGAANEADRTEVEVEYQALRWLLLNMEASNSAVSFLFRYRHAY